MTNCPDLKICKTCNRPFPKPRNVARSTYSKRQYCSRPCINLSKHGEAWKTSEYGIWQALIQRCTNPNSVNWHKYGARGIQVCDAWRNSYQNFLRDVGRRPTVHHSLDRIDNDKGYYPENCKWVTSKQQARNTRWNRQLKINGKTACVAEWAEVSGIKPNTITCRLRKGWAPERAVFEPVRKAA